MYYYYYYYHYYYYSYPALLLLIKAAISKSKTLSCLQEKFNVINSYPSLNICLLLLSAACEKESFVTKMVVLPNRGLSGIISPSIGNLIHLYHLKLSHINVKFNLFFTLKSLGLPKCFFHLLSTSLNSQLRWVGIYFVIFRFGPETSAYLVRSLYLIN